MINHKEERNSDDSIFSRLNSIPAFSKHFNAEELSMIARRAQVCHFSEEDMLVEQGEYPDGILIILEGDVSLKARTLGKEVAKIETLKAGDFLGETSFICNVPCTATAIAITPTIVIKITRILFSLFEAYFPETRYSLLKLITMQVCRRLKEVHDKVAEFMHQSDMRCLSLFGRVIHSLTQPKNLALSDNERGDVIKSCPLFAECSREDLKHFWQHASLLEAPKDCILVHENDKKPACYIVLRGAVQSCIIKNNKIAKLSVIGPNSLFANIACVNQRFDFTISYITCESTLLLQLTEEGLACYEKQQSRHWFKLFDLISFSIIALGRSIDKLDIRLQIETYNR